MGNVADDTSWICWWDFGAKEIPCEGRLRAHASFDANAKRRRQSLNGKQILDADFILKESRKLCDVKENERFFFDQFLFTSQQNFAELVWREVKFSKNDKTTVYYYYGAFGSFQK